MYSFSYAFALLILKVILSDPYRRSLHRAIDTC